MSAMSLSALAATLATIPDPRSKQGVSHPYHGMLALVLIGLIAQIPCIAQIRRWAKKHWKTLKEPLQFKRDAPPVDTTFSRALAKTTVADFQQAIAAFLQVVIAEDHDTITAAVDGKSAKQMYDADGEPLLMLNIFAHKIKVTLMSCDVHGDKTNEPGCLKAHLHELFKNYPMLQVLTGDAIFAQRPLLEVLKEYGCDYLFQIKGNQPDILDATKTCFAEVDIEHPDHEVVEKKGSMLKREKSGATWRTPNMSVSG